MSFSEERQYELAALYHFNAPETKVKDTANGATIKLPPGAVITGGRLKVVTAGAAGNVTVLDSNATPESLFGAVPAATPGDTTILLFPYYPSGTVLTVSATNAEMFIRVTYVVDGRMNEQYIA